MPTTQRVTSAEDIGAVAALAHEIWNQHFTPIIGQEQVDYMLGKFQSVPRGVRELWLTVNKDNVDSIAFYQRLGFVIAEPLVMDIGNGFVMDDYRMVKRVG